MSDEYIKREDAVSVIAEQAMYESDAEYSSGTTAEDLERWKDWARELLEDIPSVDVVERKRGEWKEKEVVDYEETTITQWQSACCSVCGKYHTTPYMYYFDDFNFCPNCGCRMKGADDET